MRISQNSQNSPLALWGLIAVVSPASEIVCQFIMGGVPAWLLWARIAVLAMVFAATALLNPIRVLRPFCLAYLFQLTLVGVREITRNSDLYHSVVSNYGFVGQIKDCSNPPWANDSQIVVARNTLSELHGQRVGQPIQIRKCDCG
jgi:hypothetical protein